ncbi:Transmembrane amino acid transporter protein, putative [Angomonas deanei]|uniref:Transmembrane amino acid transporter protein, putative n=1 Tax=Angomonas deanei TaxID=59799 RepID=A0A7G2CN37_9TRYP|nr:Transmembrane amino acid transporter protein, putative [Angomonas deanei]
MVDFIKETAQAVIGVGGNDGKKEGEGEEEPPTAVDAEEEERRKGVAGRASSAIGHGVEAISGAIDAVPELFVKVIPDSIISEDKKRLIFVDFSNTMRSFFHTNVLSMPYVLHEAGLVGGIMLLIFVAFTSEYATEAYFGVKNQMRNAHKVVLFGDVPRMIWGDWYPMLNVFYGITHLIGFLAFAASNSRVLLAAMGLTGGGAMAVSLIVPSVIALPLVFMKREIHQQPLSIISNLLVLVSVIMMLSYFPYSSKAVGLRLWPKSATNFFGALGVAVYAFTGIGSCVPIERSMSPRRYVVLLRVAVGLAWSLLLFFGLCGYISYGTKTCSVMTVSLQPGGMKTAVSAILFVASLAIIPQQTFPLAELCDRLVLGATRAATYYDWKANVLRLSLLVVSIFAAWIVPYYGLMLAISGSFGCGIIGIVVPAGLDYVRRRRWGLLENRYLHWWEYIIIFGLGGYGCIVVVVGVSFGMYKMWITIQTNSSDGC